jgi:uncharacterized coiled-coil DUF342 family protein
LKEENDGLKIEICKLKEKVNSLMLDLSDKNQDLYHLQRKRDLLEKDIEEFNAMRKEHEKRFDEFQRRYDEFRKKYRENEK